MSLAIRNAITDRLFSRGSVAVEEDTSGKVNKEIEHMFYAKIGTSNVESILMKAASLEMQEQWGLWLDKTDKNVACGSVRIRKTISYPIVNGVLLRDKEEVNYILTTKIKTKEWDALEISIPTTEDNFKAFKLLAESGMVKHRYTYPVPGTDLKFEVDMFVKPNEDVTSRTYMNVCKIDLEVTDKAMEIPAFPEGFVDVFNAKVNEDTTEEQKELIATMQPFLSLSNPHLNPVYQGL